MNRLDAISSPWPPQEVGKLTEGQVAQRADWDTYGREASTTDQVMWSLRQEKKRASTVTHVNIIEPASAGWIEPPGSFAPVVAAGRQ